VSVITCTYTVYKRSVIIACVKATGTNTHMLRRLQAVSHITEQGPWDVNMKLETRFITSYSYC
jgi:hypothetical protein